jgi:hypothetical protein
MHRRSAAANALVHKRIPVCARLQGIDYVNVEGIDSMLAETTVGSAVSR